MELAKGAEFTAASYDKTQKIEIISGKVTVGGKAGIARIAGEATGKEDASIDGTLNIWLAIFRYQRPDGTTNHVAGWNIPLSLKAGQTALESAEKLALIINSSRRPYRAASFGCGSGAELTIVYSEGEHIRTLREPR